MARTQPHAAESQPPAPSGDTPRKRPGRADVESRARPAPRTAGGALFHALTASGVDPEDAYTAVREMESMAGQSVVAELGAQIQSFASEVRNDLQEVKSRLSGVESRLSGVESGLAEVRSDVAVLKKEVRLIWGALSLLVVTLTAILIRLFAN